MIEAMEQQMINSISGRWTKDKSKRKEIDIHKLTNLYDSKVSCCFIVFILQ